MSAEKYSYNECVGELRSLLHSRDHLRAFQRICWLVETQVGEQEWYGQGLGEYLERGMRDWRVEHRVMPHHWRGYWETGRTPHFLQLLRTVTIEKPEDLGLIEWMAPQVEGLVVHPGRDLPGGGEFLARPMPLIFERLRDTGQLEQLRALVVCPRGSLEQHLEGLEPPVGLRRLAFNAPEVFIRGALAGRLENLSRWIDALDELQYFHLDIPTEDFFRMVDVLEGSNARLQRLRLKFEFRPSHREISRLLRLPCCAQLEALELSPSRGVSSREQQKFMSTIASSPCAGTLREFRFQAPWLDQETLAQHPNLLRLTTTPRELLVDLDEDGSEQELCSVQSEEVFEHEEHEEHEEQELPEEVDWGSLIDFPWVAASPEQDSVEQEAVRAFWKSSDRWSSPPPLVDLPGTTPELFLSARGQLRLPDRQEWAKILHYWWVLPIWSLLPPMVAVGRLAPTAQAAPHHLFVGRVLLVMISLNAAITVQTHLQRSNHWTYLRLPWWDVLLGLSLVSLVGLSTLYLVWMPTYLHHAWWSFWVIWSPALLVLALVVLLFTVALVIVVSLVFFRGARRRRHLYPRRWRRWRAERLRDR